MSGFSYIDCYLSFLEKFKPIKYYPDYKEIIKTAMDAIVDVFNQDQYRNESFIEDIKLVYPNYFTERIDGRFESIIDELVCFNKKDSCFEDTRNRVLQHMSYYLTGERFVRISQTLLQNEKIQIYSFYVEQDIDNEGVTKYKISINGDLDKVASTTPLANGQGIPQFPVEVCPSRIKGDFEKNDSADTFSVYTYRSNEGNSFSTDSTSNQTKDRNNDKKSIKYIGEFVQAYHHPLSAHYILLKNTSLLYVYSRTAQIGKSGASGYGGLFVLIKQGLDKYRIKEYIRFFQLISDCISICVAHNIINERQKKESYKSAKAAIMSRNVSHNLGSHVMFYLKQKLESVSSIFNEGVLKELIQAKSVKELKSQLHTQKFEKEMPFLVGVGRFINYLQERQDYIATVATNYIPYQSAINFKDAIYDELKPEKRFERHKDDRNAQNHKSANLLLDYIAYSEGFTSSDRIELKFKRDNVPSKEFNELDYFDGSGNSSDVPKGLREINIAFPGGMLGRQAFFSIIENIIRNTAKHEHSHMIGGKMTFFIDVLQPDDIRNIHSFSWRKGEDDKRNNGINVNTEKNSCYKQYGNDLLFLGISIKLNSTENEIQNTLNKIGDGLRQGYLISGRMDESCKGLKEMRISAAWIRGKEMDDEISSDEPPAIAIRKTDDGRIQYIVCLPKPKKVAFIVNTQSIKNDENIIKKGNHVFHSNELDDSDLYNQIADYDIVAVDRSVSIKGYNKLKSKVGTRIFKAVIDQNQVLNTSEQFLYKEWLCEAHEFTDETFPKISLLDDGANMLQCDKSVQRYIQSSGSSQNDESYYDNCIIFNTHYPGQPYLDSQDRELFAKACFVESVTGDNSTDRLIRRDQRDWKWYAKHVAAGKTKIAVFDERIYEMIMPSSKSIELTEEEKTEIKNKVVTFCQNNSNADASTKIGFVQNMLDTQDTIKAASLIRESGNNNDGFSHVDDLAYRIIKFRESNGDSDSDYSNAWKYREKGIWTYNIKVVDKSIHIIGYSAPVVDPIGLYSINYCAKTLAIIRRDNKTNEIKVDPIGIVNLKKFDFITIHQGILDKIYNTLGVYTSGEKKLVTERLFDCFSIQKKVVFEGAESDKEEIFLPQLIIHSGRSKPNLDDMPQKQPFLTFSALDQAIRDCKYTLTELLYSAHYEQGGNNN